MITFMKVTNGCVLHFIENQNNCIKHGSIHPQFKFISIGQPAHKKHVSFYLPLVMLFTHGRNLSFSLQ